MMEGVWSILVTGNRQVWYREEAQICVERILQSVGSLTSEVIYAYIFSEENLVSEDTLPADDEDGGGNKTQKVWQTLN